jgi:hypothetical protein
MRVENQCPVFARSEISAKFHQSLCLEFVCSMRGATRTLAHLKGAKKLRDDALSQVFLSMLAVFAFLRRAFRDIPHLSNLF